MRPGWLLCMCSSYIQEHGIKSISDLLSTLSMSVLYGLPSLRLYIKTDVSWQRRLMFFPLISYSPCQCWISLQYDIFLLECILVVCQSKPWIWTGDKMAFLQNLAILQYRHTYIFASQSNICNISSQKYMYRYHFSTMMMSLIPAIPYLGLNHYFFGGGCSFWRKQIWKNGFVQNKTNRR